MSPGTGNSPRSKFGGLRAYALTALVCGLIGCTPRNMADLLGVKPRNLTPEEWATLQKPGNQHELLGMLIGEWDVDVVSWRDPKSNPERSKGRSSSTWVLGYRYVREKFVGLDRGPRYEGLGFLGYDAGARMFSTVWMDSLNTSIATQQGLFNSTTATFEFRGEIYDPLLGRMKETRTFIRILSPDSYEVSMIDRTARGVDFKSLEMTYRRVSPPPQSSSQKR